MARGDVILKGYSKCKSFRLYKKFLIDEFKMEDGKYLYYAKNSFASDVYESEIIMYAFEIVKTTNFYNFLSNGQRISVGAGTTGHKRLGITPEDAVKKAMSRAQTYLRILMDKAQNVNAFIDACNLGNSGKDLRDLRGFARFIESLGEDEEIPAEAYRDIHAGYREIPY